MPENLTIFAWVLAGAVAEAKTVLLDEFLR
jgi:hypothetical protein